MVGYIEYLKLPATIGGIIVVCFLIMQIIGGILDFRGKTVPVIMNIGKYFKDKKREKQEAAEALREVRIFLDEINGHYPADEASKREGWMQWVNGRAAVYDESIEKLRGTLSEVIQVLQDNTKMTEEMFVQSSRDRIIDFATKVEDKNAMVSREEFNRIFNVYDKYEKFLKERGLKNGEIDINYQIIRESYEERVRGRTFTEDIRGYTR